MKTLNGKELRKLFNRYEAGFCLSEFEYSKDFDPLSPEYVGKELKLGYKRKADIWYEEDAAPYAEFIATRERLRRGWLTLEINRVWSCVYPAYAYATGERINVRAKGRGPFKYETVQEKQYELPIVLGGLKDLECEIAMISSKFEIEKHSMHYFCVIFDTEHYINDRGCSVFSAAKVVRSVAQYIGYIDKDSKASCDEFYPGSYECLDDDQGTPNYLSESCAEDIDADKDLIGKNELLVLSPKELYQLLVSEE